MPLPAQRNNWRDFVDLAGLWQCRADAEDIGLGQGWQGGLPQPCLPIAIPGSWNEQLAEVGLMNFMGPLWLETKVFVSAGFARQDLVLRFGGVDYSARVWVNGQELGQSGPQHLPFECHLGSAAKAGQVARIVLRVEAVLPEQGPTQRVTADDYVSEGRLKDEYWPAVRFYFLPRWRDQSRGSAVGAAAATG